MHGTGVRSAITLLACALVIAACGGSDGGGGREARTPGAVKSCLDAAGFDTSSSTGLESVFSAGRSITYRDEFAAERRGEAFLLWFLNNETDAKALAQVLKELRNAPPGQPRVEGTVVFGHELDASPANVQTVERCLGLTVRQ